MIALPLRCSSVGTLLPNISFVLRLCCRRVGCGRQGRAGRGRTMTSGRWCRTLQYTRFRCFPLRSRNGRPRRAKRSRRLRIRNPGRGNSRLPTNESIGQLPGVQNSRWGNSKLAPIESTARSPGVLNSRRGDRSITPIESTVRSPGVLNSRRGDRSITPARPTPRPPPETRVLKNLGEGRE